jgi:NADP-dependent 3-hydroxy acid dehydrogenase YdfG
MTFDRIMRPADGAAWITGASEGIGRATTLRLCAEGWTVHATARSLPDLERLKADAQGPGRIIPAPGDVTDPAAMTAIVEGITGETMAAQPLALVILNAGVYVPMRAEAFRAATARRMFDVNLGGVANGLEPALAHMIARRSGHVAITASVAGYRGLPDAAIYSATKAGLIAMAEARAMDLVDLGVRISVINPGQRLRDALPDDAGRGCEADRGRAEAPGIRDRLSPPLRVSAAPSGRASGPGLYRRDAAHDRMEGSRRPPCPVTPAHNPAP